MSGHTRMATSTEHPFAAGDLAPLLNQAGLRLSPDLKVAELSGDRLAVKYVPGRRYLVLAPKQWEMLQVFGAGKTVTQVLCAAIAAQRCPSLREFYELVVKAVRAGILLTEVVPAPPPVPVSRWSLRINGTFMRWLTLLAAVGAGVCLWRRGVQRLPEADWLALGWVAACAFVSLGWMLAAGVVRASGAEVYRARLKWKTLAPRFVADLDDALLGGRSVRLNAALARLAPILVATALAAWRRPELLTPLLVGILLLLSPLWRAPLQEILAALYRDPQLATSYDLVLVRERLFALLSRARRGMADGKFLLACALATVVWLLVVFLGGCVLLQTNAVELWHRFNAANGAHYVSLVLLAAAGLVVVSIAGLVLWIVFRHLRAWAKERSERRLRPAAVLVSSATIAEWLARSVLFRDLSEADLEAVAAAVKPEEHKRGSYVVKEGEAGEKLYVVLSGRLEVRRDYAPGRSEPVAEMGEGGVFGEIALVRGGVRTRSVRALEKSILLGLAKADFERLVLTRMTRSAVEDAVQKVSFLERLEFAHNWSHATLSSFARRAKLQEYPEGGTVIGQGNNNHWFFIVYRGELAVFKDQEEVRRLEPGDTFGEMSLLGDGIATATVKATSKEASCLVISGTDFLDFVTKDFAVGLGWDDVRVRPKKR
jgi:cAMP-dependent protein kinase regulator